eukprot:TRINITY_DN239_c0_g1_i2.p2 TRINITY_DN239_c0_g1~~TRINITY_DN239_c0_g1_i2.p2  ORF type:complete len:158 (-),score=83.05 TRINITY_DN239_c0_g1_i2:77-484(-)
MADKAAPVTIRTKKYITNRLLSRKQMVLDVFHPGRANVSKSELREQVSRMFKVNDLNTIFLFGFRTQFGGAKSSGFCLIYDNLEAAKSFEPKYRLIRAGLKHKIETSRRTRKELKNKKKKVRGKAKNAGGAAKQQ